MDKIEIYLLLNSVLIGLLMIVVSAVGFFLKDLHREFKRLIEKVNELASRQNAHVGLFERLADMYEKRLDKHGKRLEKIEEKQRA